MAWDIGFETAFNPRVVAVVGVSRKAQQWGGGGMDFIRRLQEAGFAGRIYPINPRATEILGLKAYPSVSSLPEPVDLVIVSVPAPAVPLVLEDCISAGARNVHIFTSGFDETGEEEGKELGRRVRQTAQGGGLRIIGPNCMGLYVPAAKLTMWGGERLDSGPVAFLSQSGGNAIVYVEYLQEYGIGFSKVVSYGNAYGLDSTDFLEYLATDPETKVICMYLEGVKDGRKFTQLVREINPIKPVIIWKGGLTELGARAVSSHTGSLAGQEAIWDAFFKQTGAVRVKSVPEMADVTMAFLSLNPPQGRRLAILSGGGGNSVAAADDCAREGLEIPVLTSETREQLRSFVPLAGNSVKNPLDVWPILRDAGLLKHGLELVASDPSIDMLTIEPELGRGDDRGPNQAQKIVDTLHDFAKDNSLRKPLVVVLATRARDSEARAEQRRLRANLIRAGIPVYSSLSRACRALSRFAEYHRIRREVQGN